MSHGRTGRLLLALLLALPASAVALTDPTRPWSAGTYGQPSGSDNAGWNLDSVLVSSSRRVAIINGRDVSEGERVGNARVISIRRNSVVLQENGKQFRLGLVPDIIRKLP